MDITLVIVLLASGLMFKVFVSQKREAGRELSRFKGEEADFLSGMASQLNTAAVALAQSKKKKNTVGYHAKASEDEKARKLAEAGLETEAAQGKFLLFRIACALICPAIGACAYLYVIPYYATLATITMTAVGVLAPIFWLKSRTTSRTEDIQRELPLVLDLTNLGTSAGWDVSSALERVIDALYVEFPEHPLIKELKRARWSIANGYTWEEGLTRVADKLGDDTVRRTTLALVQAIRQGGDRSTQLEGIAGDAQRIYYTNLDKRLAALPVKALLMTMLLMMAYFLILLTPAMVQIKSVLGK